MVTLLVECVLSNENARLMENGAKRTFWYSLKKDSYLETVTQRLKVRILMTPRGDDDHDTP